MKRLLMLLGLIAISVLPTFAEDKSATATMSFEIPKYVKVESVLNPILIANITDRTGNLHAPLKSKFRVISNSSTPQKLYLKAKTATDAGEENAMFKLGNQVYIAFGNVSKIPTSQALANCKMDSNPKDSAGIVAYPVISVTGPEHRFDYDKYEMEIKNGTSYVTLDVGPNILKSSFASNDPNGYYRTTISLTEADI